MIDNFYADYFFAISIEKGFDDVKRRKSQFPTVWRENVFISVKTIDSFKDSRENVTSETEGGQSPIFQPSTNCLEST